MESYKMNHVKSLLDHNEPVRIAYFGGSITDGAGSSSSGTKSWRALTTTWFRETYPNSEISEINAAIGGTCSDLGAFRIRKDLLPYKPDLVFVEFAVNDFGRPPEIISRGMEGIVRQIRNADNRTDIAFVYTLQKGMDEFYDAGAIPPSVTEHEKVAAHYGIPTLNFGLTLLQKINAGQETWESLTIDTVHPNDYGYSLYTEEAIGFLVRELAGITEPGQAEHDLPTPINITPFDERAQLLDAWDVASGNWTKEEKTMRNRYPHMLTSNEPGNTLDLSLKCSAFGLYWLMSPDGGDIELFVDGKSAGIYSSCDKYSLSSTRASYSLYDIGTGGEHAIRIRILPQPGPLSNGTWARIGAFMVLYG